MAAFEMDLAKANSVSDRLDTSNDAGVGVFGDYFIGPHAVNTVEPGMHACSRVPDREMAEDPAEERPLLRGEVSPGIDLEHGSWAVRLPRAE
jgi:hypothetical protein